MCISRCLCKHFVRIAILSRQQWDNGTSGISPPIQGDFWFFDAYKESDNSCFHNQCVVLILGSWRLQPDYVCKPCTGYVEYKAKQGVHIESGPLIGRDEKW